MAFDLHTIDMPDGFGPQKLDRLTVMPATLTVPAAGASVVTLGSITAGTGFDKLPVIAPTGGTLTAGVSPAVPAIVRATYLAASSATVVAAGSGVKVSDTFNLVGGNLATQGDAGNSLSTIPAATKVLVSHTKVVSAIVVAAGSGGTPGLTTFTGTTGTGTKWQGTATIAAGGTLTVGAVATITVAGNYTADPTFAGDTVTGGSLTGGEFTLLTGALTLSVSTAGEYVVSPNLTAAATTNVIGTGTGVTVAAVYGLGGAVIDDGGNYSGAPSWTVTAADGNGSGASIATGSLGSTGNPVYRALPIKGVTNVGLANVMAIAPAYMDAVVQVQSQVGEIAVGQNPNNSPPYVSLAVQPRLASNTLVAGTVNVLVIA